MYWAGNKMKAKKKNEKNELSRKSHYVSLKKEKSMAKGNIIL